MPCHYFLKFSCHCKKVQCRLSKCPRSLYFKINSVDFRKVQCRLSNLWKGRVAVSNLRVKGPMYTHPRPDPDHTSHILLSDTQGQIANSSLIIRRWQLIQLLNNQQFTLLQTNPPPPPPPPPYPTRYLPGHSHVIDFNFKAARKVKDRQSLSTAIY